MIRFHKPSPTLLLHLVAVLLGACAATGFGNGAPVAPARIARPMDDVQVRSPAAFTVGLARYGQLPAGSRWRPVGALAQGTVYRPLNQVLMLEGRPVQEAYPVLDGVRLQGFFLPAQASFAPVRAAVPLSLQKSKHVTSG